MHPVIVFMQVLAFFAAALFGFSLLYGRSPSFRAIGYPAGQRMRLGGGSVAILLFFAWAVIRGRHEDGALTMLFALSALGFFLGMFLGWLLDRKSELNARSGTPYDFDLPGPAGDPPHDSRRP